MKVDRTSRRRYAEVLRHFVAGRLTNREYEKCVDPLVESPDKAIVDVHFTIWFTYDDFRTHRLSGDHRLTDDGRRIMARAILFLHSDLPMEWPRGNLLAGVVNLVTFGLFRRLFPKPRCEGDADVWPFFRRSDLDNALSHPLLLGGAS